MDEKKKVSNFKIGLELCKAYKEEFGDLKPKRTYVTADGYPFGRWILYQREKRNKNLLSDEEIQALDSFGMVWSIENHGGGMSFEQKFEKYKDKLNSEDKVIKEFAQDLRSAKKNKGPYAGKITESMISELQSIGFVFDLNEEAWEKMYYSLIPVYDRFKAITKEYCSEKQWTWVRHQREKLDEISEEKQLLLAEIGIGNNIKAEQWNMKFRCAREYYIENEHLLVPYETVVNGVRLGEWVSRQRKKYAENMLEPYQIEKLESIGMVWDVSSSVWTSKYNVAKKYFEMYGTIDVPAVFEFEGLQLGTWIYNQKQAFWAGVLTQEKKELLDKINMNWERKYGLNISIREKIVAYYLLQIFDDVEFSYHADWLGQKELDMFIPSLSLGVEYDGERWHSDAAKDGEKDALCEKNGVNLIRIREPNAPVYTSSSLKMVLKDLSNKSLCDVVEQIVQFINLFYKTDYKVNILFEKDYPEIVRMFAVSQTSNLWHEMYLIAEKYYQEHGNLLVPTNCTYLGKNLGAWVKTQRQALKSTTKYVISEKQIALLDKISMVWDVYDLQFEENYLLAKKLYERDGKIVLNKHCGGDINKVANWEYYTRRMKQDGKLSPDKLAKYNEIEALIKKDEDQ